MSELQPFEGNGGKGAFDARQPIKIKALTVDGIRDIELRFPSDVEWAECAGRVKYFQKDLPGGIRQTGLTKPDPFELEVFNKLRTDSGPAVELPEAHKILARMNSARLLDSQFDGNSFSIVLSGYGNLVSTHTCRTPNARERERWEDDYSIAQYNPGSKKEITSFNMNIPIELYGAICQGREGYAGEVPLGHQLMVVSAVFAKLKEILAGDDPENF